MSLIPGICDTCRHFHYTMGDFGDFSDDITCDVIGTEAWEEWEKKLGEKMEEVGGTVECPLWEPFELRYCERHLIWYSADYGCPRCRAEEIVETEGGVMI